MQSGADLLLAAAKLRRLESLDVSYCESITRDAVNELIERAGSLRTLLLHNCSQLNEVSGVFGLNGEDVIDVCCRLMLTRCKCWRIC